MTIQKNSPIRNMASTALLVGQGLLTAGVYQAHRDMNDFVSAADRNVEITRPEHKYAFHYQDADLFPEITAEVKDGISKVRGDYLPIPGRNVPDLGLDVSVYEHEYWPRFENHQGRSVSKLWLELPGLSITTRDYYYKTTASNAGNTEICTSIGGNYEYDRLERTFGRETLRHFFLPPTPPSYLDNIYPNPGLKNCECISQTFQSNGKPALFDCDKTPKTTYITSVSTISSPLGKISTETWVKMQKPLYGLEIFSTLVILGGLAFKVGKRVKKEMKAEKDGELILKHKDVVRTDPNGYRVNLDKSGLQKVKKFINELEAEDPERAARLAVVIHLAGQGYPEDSWKPYAEENWLQIIASLSGEDMKQLISELHVEGMGIEQVCEETEMKEFKRNVR